MEFATLRDKALSYREWLLARKQEIDAGFDWYPFDTLANVLHLDGLLSGENRNVFGELAGRRIADIGAADGDLGFFLESELGCHIDVVDTAAPNYNQLRGARLLAESLGSSAEIHDVDLDNQFALPAEHYGAVLFLGLLYHLRNPFYVLETLARRSDLCFVSTRVAQLSPDHGTRLAEQPIAYLLHPAEANNDPTNYWIFSEAGLRRLFERTGWEVLDFTTVGCRTDSDPAAQDRDERAFALLRSRWAQDR